MLLINANAMVTLLMPIWNLMTFSMMGGVCPSVLAIQVPMIKLVPMNSQIPTMPQQRSTASIVGSDDGQSSPPVSPLNQM